MVIVEISAESVKACSFQAQVSNLVFDESEESGVGGLTVSREEGMNNWCHDVVDENVYAVYLVGKGLDRCKKYHHRRKCLHSLGPSGSQ